MTASYKIIDTRSELKKFAKSLETETVFAVDLEADSMYHFQEKVCLVQMATRTASAVIDPIKIKDLSVLAPLFFNRNIKKIFHGADYDVRSLYRDFGIEINNLFDTQMACMFLGLEETGLDAVLQQRFNVRLDKKYQKKDWSRRPLPGQMMAYAAADVIYLIPLAEILEQELEKKGRLAWVREESEIISKVRPASGDDQPLYLKFKGAGRLGRRGLAILEALLRFRMQLAGKKDKPPFKIFGNEAVMKIVQQRPLDLAGLKKANAFSPKLIGIYGPAIIAIINSVVEIPENELPVYPKKRTPLVDAKVPQRVKALKSWRASKARALKIDAGLIFSNALISVVAAKNPLSTEAIAAIDEMKNWQKKEFGSQIVGILKKIR
ncbi:MAG: HRDC domain-containing protein [Proteobacteria bacterium]|nr:HRDC domain-containing protein [Pseudomonadota bacterium]